MLISLPKMACLFTLSNRLYLTQRSDIPVVGDDSPKAADEGGDEPKAEEPEPANEPEAKPEPEPEAEKEAEKEPEGQWPEPIWAVSDANRS